MTMVQTKESLVGLLGDSQVKVLALSGNWGTGKTEMLRQIREATQDERIKNALTVSLFGVSSLSEMKLKLAQCALPLLQKKGPKADAVRTAIGGLKTGLQGLFQINSAIDELALLAVPTMVRGKFIVLDDIERKHEGLSIDEILGFIDDFTQNYGCRIMLILNTDQLAEKQIWEMFREKVIDEELRLETTPAEAFEIAVSLSPSTYSSMIRPVVEACGLTNIRIIRKVIRTVNRILAQHSGLAKDVLSRVIPSTVLLSAIHFKGINGGPTLDFVLGFGCSMGRAVRQINLERRGGQPTEEEKLHSRWAILLSQVGISSSDEFEVLVASFLGAGLVDQSALDAVLTRYRREQRHAGARLRVQEFFESTIWYPDLTQSEVLDRAQALLEDVPFVDCYTVTALHNKVSILTDGGETLADQMISSWVDRLRDMAAAPGAEPENFSLANRFGRQLHPRVVEAFAEARGQLEQTRTLMEVCLDIVRTSGWGPAEEAVLQSATAQNYTDTLLSACGENLKLFMYKNLDILANRSTYPSFGSAPDRFLDACIYIRNTRSDSSWSQLINDLFAETRLLGELNAETPIAAE